MTRSERPPGTQRARKTGRGAAKPLRISWSRPTLRGSVFGILGILGVLIAYGIGRTEFLYAAGFLILLPLVGLVVVRIRPLRLTVVRRFSPAVVTAGTPTVIELSVRNVSGFASAAAVWSDRIPWFPHTAGPGTLPVLAPGAVATGARGARLGYSLRPTMRGVYDIGPLEVGFTDPFGLASGRVAVGGRQSLYVIPLVVPLGDAGSIAVSGEGTARLIQHTAVGNDDDLMTREYRTGDALRRVHWRASARHGELMVRQEEQRSYPEARLLIDTRMDGYGAYEPELAESADGFGWFEWAITMVASLGVHLHRSGFLVQILEAGLRQIAPLGDANQGSGQDVEFLLSLAGVRLTGPRRFAGNEGDDRTQRVLGPIFAVVAQPSSDTLRWIISQRRPYETGVAFVIDTGIRGIGRALADAGWICVPVKDTDDPAAVWATVAGYTAETAEERR
jgi:uncharacterized protein (DUF58 family)